jgi:hypothetical protein
MADGRPDGSSTSGAWSAVRNVLIVVGLIASVAFAMALYLKAPIERELVVPSGADIPSHLWRMKLVTSQGLQSLFDSAPLTIQTNPDRIGLPVLGSILSGLGVSPWHLMYVAASVAAGVVAASGWVFARSVPEPRWAGPIYGLAVAASIAFAVTSRAYLDNILANGMLVAIAAIALLAATNQGATLAGVVLLGGIMLLHWPTGVLFVGVLILFTVSLLPSAISDRSKGRPITSTAAARVGTMAVGGAVLGGIPLVLTPGANAPTPGTGQLFRLNVERILPSYRLRLTLPLAAVGAAALALIAPTTPRRRTAVLCAVWFIPLAVAALAYSQGRPLPLMRFFGTALAIPLLGAAAFTGLIAIGSRLTSIVAVNVVVTIVTVGLVGAVLWGAANDAADHVDNTAFSLEGFEIEPIRLANALVERIDPPAAVFVVDGATRSFRRIRMLAPGPIIDRLHVFPGTPAELFRRARASDDENPADVSDEGFAGRKAVIQADAVRALRQDGALAIVVRPYFANYDRLARDPRNVEVGDGVLLLRPSSRPPVVRTTPLSPPTTSSLISSALVAFGALFLAGSGWSFALLKRAWDVRLALAPAMGIAVLVLVGCALGLAGVKTGHEAGLVIWLVVTGAGWIAATWIWANGPIPEDVADPGASERRSLAGSSA